MFEKRQNYGRIPVPCLPPHGPLYLTFGTSGGGDFPRPRSDVVDDGILEPGDPAGGGGALGAKAPPGRGIGWGPGGGRALPEVQPLGQDGVLLHTANAVEEDGALAALHCGDRAEAWSARAANAKAPRGWGRTPLTDEDGLSHAIGQGTGAQQQLKRGADAAGPRRQPPRQVLQVLRHGRPATATAPAGKDTGRSDRRGAPEGNRGAGSASAAPSLP